MSMPRKIAVPAARSSAAALAVRKRVFMGLLVAAIALALISPIISWKMSAAGPPPAPTQISPRLAAVAEQAGEDFLAGRNSSVPAASGVSTDWSGEQTPTYTSSDLKDPQNVAHLNAILLTGVSKLQVGALALQGYDAEQIGDVATQIVYHVRFRVTVNNAPYLLTVPLLDDPKYGTLLGGEPALLPASTGTHDVPSLNYKDTYSDAKTDLVTDAVTSSINAWATAYARGGINSDALRKVVNDQDVNRTYNGLGGWYAQVEDIVNAVPIGGGKSGKPKGLIVQVSVQLAQHPLTSSSSLGSGQSAANGFSLSSTYDLYVVTQGNPANPPVVAWGAAGAVKELTPYMNAN